MLADTKNADTQNLDSETICESEDGSKLRAQWVAKIRKAHDKTAVAIIELGRTLNEAKAALDKSRQWLIVFEQNELPFSLSLAERYMKIADHKLSNSANLQILPPAVSTLYELSKLPDDEFGQAMADGTISPEMTCKQATAVVNGARIKPNKKSTNGADPNDDPALPIAVLGEIDKKITELTQWAQQGKIAVDAEFKKKVQTAAKRLMALLDDMP